MSQINKSIVRNEESAVNSSDALSIAISRNLHERILKRLDQSEFVSVDSYVAYVMEQVLNEIEKDDGRETPKSNSDGSPFSKEDQESVEQRLRDLGYL